MLVVPHQVGTAHSASDTTTDTDPPPVILLGGVDIELCTTRPDSPGGLLGAPLADLARALDARSGALDAHEVDAIRDAARQERPELPDHSCLDGVGGVVRLRSPEAPLAGTGDAAQAAADLAAVVRAAADVHGPVDVVGVSAGGFALRVALATDPSLGDDIRRAVLITTPQEGSWLAGAAAELGADGGGPEVCGRRGEAVGLAPAEALALCLGVLEADGTGQVGRFLEEVLASPVIRQLAPDSPLIDDARSTGFAEVEVLQVASSLRVERPTERRTPLAGWATLPIPGAPARDPLDAGDLVGLATDLDDQVPPATGTVLAHPWAAATASSITTRVYRVTCEAGSSQPSPGSPLLVRTAVSALGSCIASPASHAILPRAEARRLPVAEGPGQASLIDDVTAFLDR